MQGIDLARFQFDYDLTFAIVFLNADGAVYGSSAAAGVLLVRERQVRSACAVACAASACCNFERTSSR